MAGFAVLIYAAVVVIAVVAVWSITHRRRPAVLSPRIEQVVAAARRRAFVAVSVAIVVLFAGVVAGGMLPSLLGLPLVAAPFVAGAAGLLLYAATPPGEVIVPAGQARTAALTRRSWATALPARWLHAGVETVVIFVAVLVFCGITADADDQGRSRAIRFEAGDFASTASPYPGWFYGVPALLGLVVLVVATLLALQRIGAAPVFPHPDDAEADAQWRRASAAVVLKLSSGAVLFALGGIALTAGIAMRNAVIEGLTPSVWGVIGDVLLIGGALFFILSAVGVTLAALTAFTIGERLSPLRRSAPAPVR